MSVLVPRRLSRVSAIIKAHNLAPGEDFEKSLSANQPNSSNRQMVPDRRDGIPWVDPRLGDISRGMGPKISRLVSALLPFSTTYLGEVLLRIAKIQEE